MVVGVVAVVAYPSDRGLHEKEHAQCCSRAEVWPFPMMGQPCPKLSIAIQPMLLGCLVCRSWSDGHVAAPVVLRVLPRIWDPCFALGECRVHPWPQVSSSLLHLHYWNPTKTEPSFHQHRANQDNTYLNFIYSLNRQDRQRVAVETKALERWCDMTRSHSRRLREPGADWGFLTPDPNDLSIRAR